MNRYGGDSRHSPMHASDRKVSEGNRDSTTLRATSTTSSAQVIEPLHGVAGSEAMDITPHDPATLSTMGPPLLHNHNQSNQKTSVSNTTSPNGDLCSATHSFGLLSSVDPGTSSSPTSGAGMGSVTVLTASTMNVAGTPQPKLIQTAFIHKLYNMLEDPAIQHLISWSTSNESFVVSPSNEFSKVLSQYFKHTNISSFVRQLNMYGFHKVSDVFHTGAPESTLWEFKHGNGSFKRGHIQGLRDIKRRASRHALINRDTYSTAPKPNMSQPGAPAEPMLDSTEARLQHLEHSLYDVHARLGRSEEHNQMLVSRYQFLQEGLIRCHQWSQHLSHTLTSMLSNPENPQSRDLVMMQQEIARQIEILREHDEPAENPFAGRQPHFSNLSLENAPLSPRQAPQDAQYPHRPNAQQTPPRSNFFRHAAPPPYLTVPPRKYGSVGNAHQSHVASVRPTVIPQPPPHPLASVSPPNASMTRRHTTADIRSQGWQGGPSAPQFGSGGSGNWSPSPQRVLHSVDSPQHVREVLARYEMVPRSGSRQTTPPLTTDTTPSTASAESTWSFGGGGGGGGAKFGSIGKIADHSASQTRRSSMASNVHSLLNPAETAETEDEDDPMSDDRKRKRIL